MVCYKPAPSFLSGSGDEKEMSGPQQAEKEEEQPPRNKGTTNTPRMKDGGFVSRYDKHTEET